MTTLNFFRAIVEAKDKGLHIDLIPVNNGSEIFVIVTTPLNAEGNPDYAYQDKFSTYDIKGQTDFIEYAVRNLQGYYN